MVAKLVRLTESIIISLTRGIRYTERRKPSPNTSKQIIANSQSELAQLEGLLSTKWLTFYVNFLAEHTY